MNKLGRKAKDEAMDVFFEGESEDQQNEEIKEIRPFPGTNISKMDELIIRMDTLEAQLSFLTSKTTSAEKKLDEILKKLK